MPDKYYIYAGGRWCEVDVRRGRVEGFRQRPRFCYLRGGRLEVGRTAGVLRALRTLAAGAGGAARKAAPLHHLRPHRPRRDSARAHRCCSQHHQHSRCDVNANELADKAPAISVSETPRKRKRSTSEDSHKAKQAKSDHSPNRSPQKLEREIARNLLQSGTEDKKEQKLSPQKKTVKVRGEEEEKIVQSLLQTSSSEDNVKQKKTKPGPRRLKDKENIVQDINSSSENTVKPKAKKEEKVSDIKSSSSEKTVKQKAKKEENVSDIKSSSAENIVKPKARKEEKSDETRSKSAQKRGKFVRGKEEEKLVQSLLESSSSDEELDSSKTQTKSKPLADSDKSDSSSDSSTARKPECKELVIEDRDVRVLRRFLARAVGDGELKRFDKDKTYKTRVFYKLNPLVCLKRCVPLERLLTQQLSLAEFARQLGLRSVADVTPEKRYRMRNSTRQARNTASVTSDSEKEKTNIQPRRRQLWNRDKQVFSQSSRSSEIQVKPQIHRPARESSKEPTDSDTEVKQHIKRHLERRASARTNPKEKEESIVVESDSDGNIGKRRLSLRGKNKESVVVSDESAERNKKKGGDNESVVISDDSESDSNNNNIDDKTEKPAKKTESKDPESDSNTDDNDNRPARRTRSKGPEKRVTREHKKTIDISDSDSAEDIRKTSDSDDDGERPPRRTRSQGPEKRELREHKKSLIISDTDSNRQDIRKTRGKESEKKKNKSIVVSDSNSNTDINQGKHFRTRSEGPEQNKKNYDGKKENDKKTTDDETIESKKITRSSMKIADVKETQAVPSKKGKVTASSKTENEVKRKQKPGPSKTDKESKKAESEKDVDKSVISDSSDAFETSKISKKDNKKVEDVGKKLNEKLPRNVKGRFKKQEDIKHRQNIVKGKPEKEINKANVNRIDNNKDIEEKKKVLRDKVDKYRNEREENKGSDKNTENRGKENSKKAAVARSMFVKPVKFKKSCVANGREYTSLEDHAIVAWVSVGNREKLVNGNSVWRELQSEYTRLTSQTRSWHSLRNRYLRYILPSLGQLALPPAQVSRLRAAAAVGQRNYKQWMRENEASKPIETCMRLPFQEQTDKDGISQGKIKNKIQRRNSIFKAPRVLSAATAGRLRFRPPSGSESDNTDREKKESTPPSSRRPPPASPSKPSPSKAPRSPSPRAKRLTRSSNAGTASPKKKRIHHI